MSDLNIVCLSGRAVQTPELKQTSSKKDYCFLKIAINEYNFKTKKNEATFVSVIVGGNLASIVCDKVDKGAQVTIQAKVSIRKGDKEKGTFDQITLRAESVVFSAAPKQEREESEETEEEPI